MSASVCCDSSIPEIRAQRETPPSPLPGRHTLRSSIPTTCGNRASPTASLLHFAPNETADGATRLLPLLIVMEFRSAVCVVHEPLVCVRRHKDNRKTEVSRPYVARDYSLRKLARQLDGVQRVLVEQERSENSLALAVETAALHSRRRALAVIGKSLTFSWKYPRWWYRAAKTILRVCFQ